jgi:hypothetical protein
LKAFAGDDDDLRRNYRGYRAGVFDAFETSEGPIRASMYCEKILAAVVITAKPGRRVLGVFREPERPTLHIMNNLMESRVEDLEIMELIKLLYACQELGRRANEFLAGGDRSLVVQATFDVATDVLAILDERKGASSDSTPSSHGAEHVGVEGSSAAAAGDQAGGERPPAAAPSSLPPAEPPQTVDGPGASQPAAALLLERDALNQVEGMFDRAARRQGQLSYLAGVLLGVLWVGLLGALLGRFLPRGRLADVDIPNMLGALVGGALGAVISVSTRLVHVSVNYEVGRARLRILGGLRPFVGAVFGIVFFALTSTGILPIKVLSPDFLFFAGLGFVAGFNERWAQGVVVRSGSTLVPGEGSST